MLITQAHAKFRCAIGVACKVGQFIETLDEILCSDRSYDEIRTSFVEYCVKCNNVFNIMYRLIQPQPQSADIAKKLEDTVASISILRDQESDLVRKLLNVCNEKQNAQEQLRESFIEISN